MMTRKVSSWKAKRLNFVSHSSANYQIAFTTSDANLFFKDASLVTCYALSGPGIGDGASPITPFQLSRPRTGSLIYADSQLHSYGKRSLKDLWRCRSVAIRRATAFASNG